MPDSKQSLGQRWVMVWVVGNTSMVVCWHWPNIGPTLKFQQLKNCMLLVQRWHFNYTPTVDFELWSQSWPNTCLLTVVIFLNIKYILIIQKLYNLLFNANCVILFYNNNFIIYLIILIDFDNLEFDKILEFVV